MPSSKLRFLRIAALFTPSLVPEHAVAASEKLGAADRCRSLLWARARQQSIKSERLLMRCAGRLLKCELKFAVEGTETSGCLDRATNACKRQVGPAADSALNEAVSRFKAVFLRDPRAQNSLTQKGLATSFPCVAP